LLKYVSFSGGADSTALAIYLKDKGEEFGLVFADTGAELPETYWIVPRVARQLGVKLVVVSGPTMFERLSNRRFMLPGCRIRWCTRELKQEPLNNHWQAGDVVCLGIRADEDHRARTPKNAPNGVEYIWPLVEANMGKSDVLKLCESRGLLNPCYEWRSSCSCFCCPFQRKSDWLNMLDRHPDLYALAEEWEYQCRLFSPVTCFTWSDRWSLRELREADEAQLAMLTEPREEACSICRW
jgi:3'-phosphoadenosine 5'-phosphosulfate sulfotransferase (PAPS reductase)/FAD synthetase